MNRKRNNNVLANFLLKMACSMACLLFGCNSEDFIIIERYENGNPKLTGKILDELTAHFYYERFYENGKIKSKSYMKDSKMEGEVVNYFPNGMLEERKYFKEDRLQGDFFSYREDGTLKIQSYFYNDQEIYRKKYISKDSIPESYIAFVQLIDDTLTFPNNKLKFEVSLLLPDSLFKNKKFYYAYQMKSEAMMDSVILKPKFQVEMDNKQIKTCTVDVNDSSELVFYGHLVSAAGDRIYYPFEKKIVILRQ